MSGPNINAKRCAEYMRQMGLDVSPEKEAWWCALEKGTRLARRAHKAELKRSCGHFNTYWSTIYHSGGKTEARCCRECHQYVEYRGASMGGGA